MMSTKDCHLCPLKDKPGPVWGEGHPSSKLVFIGMGPEKDECDANRPFVGGAGRTLNRGCFSVGINRSTDAFTTNLVKCFVPAKTHIPSEAIRCCKPLLDKELGNLANVRVTVTLGAEVFKALTGKDLAIQHNAKTAKKGPPDYWLRGAPLRSSTESKTCILPLQHPAGIAYSGFLAMPYFEADLRKVKRYATEGIHTWKEDFNYAPTDADITDYVRRCVSLGRYGLDIETPYTKEDTDEEEYTASERSPIIVCGISAQIGECMGVPGDRLSLLSDLFDGRTKCYAYNWGFDGYHLADKVRLSEGRGVYFCAMLGLHELYSDCSPKDLATALSIFTDMGYHKNLMLSQPDIYNGRDTYGALYLGLEMEPLLDSYGLRKVHEELDMPMIPILSDLQHIGVNCDVPRAQRLELQCYAILEAYEDFWAKTIPAFSWSSPEQLVQLFTQMGMKIKQAKRKRRDGTVYYSPTVNEDVLDDYAALGNQPAALVLEMRKLRKAGQFCHPYSSDHRMHTRYKNHGTGTGRLSAVDPNAQNIPEKIGPKGAEIYPRAILIPDNPDNDMFVVIDFSQMQLWIYAYAAQDIAFLQTKQSGDYIHGIMYEEILGEPFFEEGCPRQKQFKRKDVEPWKLLYIKTVPLGLCFGREADSLATIAGSRTKGQAIYDNFHMKHPQIRQFHRRLDYEVQQKGYLQNFFGRIRRFPNPKAQRNEYLNFPGQSNEPDILRKVALIPLHKELPNFGARIVLTVHDSLGVSCPKRTLAGCVSYIRDSMEQTIPEMNNFWIPVEISIGKNWQETISWEEYVLREKGW
jgi:uracil-DNA glycosylase family 4